MYSERCKCETSSDLVRAYINLLPTIDINSQQFANIVKIIYYNMDEEDKETLLNRVSKPIREAIMDGFEVIDYAKMP